MRVPWSGSNFLLRRRLDRIFADLPDALIRTITGRGGLPPRSLRSFIGDPDGAGDGDSFSRAGDFFCNELKTMRLINPGTRILDIGCGCGRMARALSEDEDIKGLDISYVGMDVDRAGVEWCRDHITARDGRFRFYHADCLNASYNPGGKIRQDRYEFPHPDASFDLILLTSVLTHLTKPGIRRYLHETARLLAPEGVAYATVFLYGSAAELSGNSRHAVTFTDVRGTHAFSRGDRPSDAIAYHEPFLREIIGKTGLLLIEPISYGSQDLVLLNKPMESPPEVVLGDGWYDLERDLWRWTEPEFSVEIKSHDPGARELQFRFDIPPQMSDALGTIQLTAIAGGVSLGTSEYAGSGEQIYKARLPAGAAAAVTFSVDKAYKPRSADRRCLGVHVPFFAPCRKGRRPLYPLRVE